MTVGYTLPHFRLNTLHSSIFEWYYRLLVIQCLEDLVGFSPPPPSSHTSTTSSSDLHKANRNLPRLFCASRVIKRLRPVTFFQSLGRRPRCPRLGEGRAHADEQPAEGVVNRWCWNPVCVPYLYKFPSLLSYGEGCEDLEPAGHKEQRTRAVFVIGVGPLWL